jgi:prevent-host-death family protein
MDRVGIRQLQKNAAITVEGIRLGESIEVTVRGRPVARLVPVAGTLVDRLEAAGTLTRATCNLRDLGPPRVRMPNGESASDRLARMRELIVRFAHRGRS